MSQRVTVVENILNANDQIAEQNLAQLEASGVLAVNLMASPGAGKTSLILSIVDRLSRRLRLGVVEGDTAPVTIDSDRVQAKGIPTVQVNTGGGCHLDAVMLQVALTQLDLSQLDLLIVENVGNLVCPANFRLGAQRNVLIASVPEGDDKPYKYPGMYRGVDALVINKIDLLPYTPFDMDYFCRGVEMLNPGLATFPLSCRTGEGLDDWVNWLFDQVRARRGS